MFGRRTSFCAVAVFLAAALPGFAEAKSQVLKDQRGDHPACAPVCDMKSVTVSQQGKRIKIVVRFWSKRAAKMSNVFSWVSIKTSKESYWLGNGLLINKRTDAQRKIRFKRRWGKQILVFPLKAIGDPKAFLWRANTGCCGISDYAPNRRKKKFRAARTGPKPLPVKMIKFAGDKGTFNIDCFKQRACRGEIAIKDGKTKLIKSRNYTVKSGTRKEIPLRLTEAGRKALNGNGRATGLGVLTAPDGDKVRFTAILKRK